MQLVLDVLKQHTIYSYRSLFDYAYINMFW